jgi:peptidoglycan/LPS O-acetylase OafA/YrhL
MDNFASRHVPELDGLRGIAIISVLIHHQLTPFSLKGGFLGVDLFFVLSGFLITGLLAAEYEQTNSISLKKFYMRRLLRLGPALLLYLFGCLIVTHYTQLISVTRQLKLIVLALVYATNWRMAFQWDTALDPTAIIWSLSIEEQFYLVWPIVLFVCLALKIKRNHIAAALAAIIVGILIHRSVMLSGGADFTRLYYGTDTRADALLMGCLFALLPVAKILSSGKRWLNLTGMLSAACLIYLMVTVGFTDRLLYQGGFTFVALLCGLLVFVAAYFPPKMLAIILSSLPLRWFGRISYGLYLWHWLVVRNTTFYYLGALEPWARLGLAITIAAASFYVVETPFNKLKLRFTVSSKDSPPTSSTREAQENLPPLALPVAN